MLTTNPIIYRYLQIAVNMWPVHSTHAVTVSHRCCERICTLYIHSMSENEIINEEKNSLITSSSLEITHFLWNYRQSNSVYRSVSFELVYVGRHARIPISKNFQARYWEFTCLKFSVTYQSNSALLLILIKNYLPCVKTQDFSLNSLLFVNFGDLLTANETRRCISILSIDSQVQGI